jgi:hypothetical protein
MREKPAAGGESTVGGNEMTPAGVVVHAALGGGKGRGTQLPSDNPVIPAKAGIHEP